MQTELGRFLSHQGQYPTAILKNPSGTFSLVGSVPIELTVEYTSGFTSGRKSRSWASEKEVIDALLSLGITRFQLADSLTTHLR